METSSVMTDPKFQWSDAVNTFDGALARYTFVRQATLTFDSLDANKDTLTWLQSYQGPCTLIPIAPDERFTPESLGDTIQELVSLDDTYSLGFADVIVVLKQILDPTHVSFARKETTLIREREHCATSWTFVDFKVSHIVYLRTDEAQIFGSIKLGPYMCKEKGLHQVYRLYDDSQSAFFSCIIQLPGGDFEEERPTTRIAVPPRIAPARRYNHQPLQGLRFGIKDLIDVRGLKTSLGSRSYFDFNLPAESTADAIEALLALGAVLLGKTKNTQFANGEDPQEWIDFECPWNPRGDGYQNPDTSSSGSATAISSYDWIDFAVGTDTCGSISCPAAAQGLFSIRFSRGTMPTRGIWQVSSFLDTMGLFTRSITELKDVSHAWVTSIGNAFSDEPRIVRPKRILYPWLSFPHDNLETLKLTEAFVRSLELYLDIERTIIDLNVEWQNFDTTDGHSTLESRFEKTTAHLHLTGFLENTAKFRNSFQDKNGYGPYLDRVNTEKLKVALEVSPEQRAAAVADQKLFTSFFNTKIFQQSSAHEMPSIMIWPFSPQEPQYRDAYPLLTPHVNWRWDIDYAAPLAGAPIVIVPVGQYTALSRVTGRLEQLPVSIAIASPPGSDLRLLAFLDSFMHEAKLTTTRRIWISRSGDQIALRLAGQVTLDSVLCEGRTSSTEILFEWLDYAQLIQKSGMNGMQHGTSTTDKIVW